MKKRQSYNSRLNWFSFGNSSQLAKKRVPTVNDESNNDDEEGGLPDFFGNRFSDDEDSEFNNQIHIYDEPINKTTLRNFKRVMKIITNNLDKLVSNFKIPTPFIEVFINTPGGDFDSSFAISDIIKASKYPVHTIVEGEACSGGSIISMSGHKRFMRPSSMILIHQLSSGGWGTWENLKDSNENNKLCMNMLYTFYGQHSNLDRAALKELLKHDRSLSAKKCLEYGMIDEILI